MKPFGFVVKLITVGFFWTLCFLTFWRSLIYAIWGFDVLFNKHWLFMWQMWQDGWVIDTLPEWMFLIVLCLGLPVWLLGWFVLMKVEFGAMLAKGAKLFWAKAKVFRRKYLGSKVLVITRRKSYLRVRPPALTYVMPISDEIKQVGHKLRAGSKESAKRKAKRDNLADDVVDNDLKANEKVFDDVNYDDENLPFDKKLSDEDKEFYKKYSNNKIPVWDTTPPVKDEPKPLSAAEKADLMDKEKGEIKEAIVKHGFEVLENVKVGKTCIDIFGVAKDKVLAVMFDAKAGDWLADEESFNKETPLWFSETAHRPSPVRELSKVSARIKNNLGLSDEIEITNLLVVADGNVINADDMLETWDAIGVKVTRAANGIPVTLPYVLEMLPVADKKPTKTFVKECKKVLKSDNEDKDKMKGVG